MTGMYSGFTNLWQNFANSIHLYKVGKEEELMFRIFKETRAGFQCTDVLGEEGREQILRQQFAIEGKQYYKMYPHAVRSFIMINDIPVGQLLACEQENYLRIIDIGLLEEYRGAGIGSFLIEGLIKDMSLKGKGITLQVSWFNRRAYQFYIRCGFRVTKKLDVAYEMEYKPSGVSQLPGFIESGRR